MPGDEAGPARRPRRPTAAPIAGMSAKKKVTPAKKTACGTLAIRKPTSARATARRGDHRRDDHRVGDLPELGEQLVRLAAPQRRDAVDPGHQLAPLVSRKNSAMNIMRAGTAASRWRRRPRSPPRPPSGPARGPASRRLRRGRRRRRARARRIRRAARQALHQAAGAFAAHDVVKEAHALGRLAHRHRRQGEDRADDQHSTATTRIAADTCGRPRSQCVSLACNGVSTTASTAARNSASASGQATNPTSSSAPTRSAKRKRRAARSSRAMRQIIASAP